jgi:hypothetical protein
MGQTWGEGKSLISWKAKNELGRDQRDCCNKKGQDRSQQEDIYLQKQF